MIQNKPMTYIKYNNMYYQHVTNPHVLTRDQLIEFILDTMKFEMPRIVEIIKRDYSSQYLERQIKTNTSQNYLTLNNPSNEVYNPITVNTEKVKKTVAETDTLRSLVISIIGWKPEQATPIQDLKDVQMEGMAVQLKNLQDKMDQIMTMNIQTTPEKEQPEPIEEQPSTGELPTGELPPIETMEKTKEEF